MSAVTYALSGVIRGFSSRVMKTLYVRPSSSSASPSRAGSWTPCSTSASPHATRPAPRAARQSTTDRRRGMRAGILVRPSETRLASRVHPRGRAEARRLVRLVARDRSSRQLHAVRLLEHHAQPVERLTRLPLDPPGGADLLEAVDRGCRLAEGRALGPHREAAIIGEAGEAEVAEGVPSVDLVDALAGQRRAPALAAARGTGGERADAAPDEHRGEVWHGN